MQGPGQLLYVDRNILRSSIRAAVSASSYISHLIHMCSIIYLWISMFFYQGPLLRIGILPCSSKLLPNASEYATGRIQLRESSFCLWTLRTRTPRTSQRCRLKSNVPMEYETVEQLIQWPNSLSPAFLGLLSFDFICHFLQCRLNITLAECWNVIINRGNVLKGFSHVSNSWPHEP